VEVGKGLRKSPLPIEAPFEISFEISNGAFGLFKKKTATTEVTAEIVISRRYQITLRFTSSDDRSSIQ
jgi:hypothetical protein